VTFNLKKKKINKIASAFFAILHFTLASLPT
jgi:hypothetical protein